MIKKILCNISLIMIICSTCVYETNAIIPEEITDSSSALNTSETGDSVANDDSENQNNTNTGSNANDNTSISSSVNINKDSNKEENKKVTNNTTVAKSSEARLKELKTDIEGLTPNFDKNIKEYYLIVDLSVKQIKISTTTIDAKATVTVVGNKNLKEGKNTITINVKAEDGKTEKYYIYVTKIDNIELANAQLEVLEIEGSNLYPDFKSNIYSYNLNINQNISVLNITTKPQRENAKIEIEGNTNLQKGENLIKIIVTAEDNTTVRTYKINAYIDSDRVEIKEENKMPAIILISILITCIIGLGIFIAIKNRK